MISRRKFAGLAASWAMLQGTFTGRAEAGEGTFYYLGPVSDHFDGTRFFNPGSDVAARGFGDFLRMQLSEPADAWPDTFPSPFRDTRPSPAGQHDLRVTLVGHATFLIQIGGLNVLTDPVWSERASPFPFAGPKRYNPPGIAFEALPRIDAVLISHNHYDHLDLPTIGRLWQRDRPIIVAPLGNDAIIRADDPGIEVSVVDWGGEVPLGQRNGSRATAIAGPAHHWSARGLSDRNHALWASYVIKGGTRTVYFAGDTGFDDGRPFQGVARRHPRVDLALLPIGAYEPRWFMKAQHMNPDDAVRAFAILGARQALGYHWGTFRLTNEAVDRPQRDLALALAVRKIEAERFLAMRPGQVWTRTGA